MNFLARSWCRLAVYGLCCLAGVGSVAPALALNHSTDISTSETWDNSVVHVVTANIKVTAGVLSITAGAVVQFNNTCRLTINGGSINAAGTSGSPIIFTSYLDNSPSQIGGTDNGKPGDWDMVFVQSSASACSFNYCIFRYGGSSSNGNVEVDTAASTALSNCELTRSKNYGLSLFANGSPVLSNCNIHDNTRCGVYINSATSAPLLSDCSITGNGSGLTAPDQGSGVCVSAGNATLTHNTITGNGAYGIYFAAAAATAVPNTNTVTGNARAVRLPFNSLPDGGNGNTIGPNTVNVIEIVGGASYPLTRNLSLPNLADVTNGAYWLASGTAVIASGSTLTLAPGTVWKSGSVGNAARLQVNGGLVADGTAPSPITFTSYRDDSIAGDTSGDGVSTGAPGDWDTLIITNTALPAQTHLQNCVLRYGGASNNGVVSLAASIALTDVDISQSLLNGLEVTSCAPTLLRVHSHHNGNDGLWLSGTTAGSTCTNSEFKNNGGSANAAATVWAGVYVKNGNTVMRFDTCDVSNNLREGVKVDDSGSSLTLVNNTITHNGTYGVYFASALAMPVPTGNLVKNNGKAVRLPFTSLPNASDSNDFTGNTVDTVEIMAGSTPLTRNLDLPSLSTLNLGGYWLISGTATVASGTTLTLQPGTVWKFGSGTAMQVNGTLVADGGSAIAPGHDSNRIVFTSYRDDTFRGDTNGDGATGGQAGDWDAIYVLNSTATASRFQNCVLRYGGSTDNAILRLDAAGISLTDVEVSQSLYDGIEIVNGVTAAAPARLTRVNCHDNGASGLYLRINGSGATGFYDHCIFNANGFAGHTGDAYHTGVYVRTGSTTPSFTNCTISGNAREGIYVEGSDAAILTDNTITNNGAWGIRFITNPAAPVILRNTVTGNQQGVCLPFSAVPNAADGNTLAPNRINGLWINGNTRSTDLTLNVQDVVVGSTTYKIHVVECSGALAMATGTTLSIGPGMILKFDDGAGLTIGGTLTAAGTPAGPGTPVLPVILTSSRDDASGGDFNLDGTATVPYGGVWQGLKFASANSGSGGTTTNSLSDCWISFGGADSATSNVFASATNALTLTRCVLSQGGTYGLRSSQGTITLTDCEVWGNLSGGIYSSSTCTLASTGGRIFANQGDGIEVGGASVDQTISGAEIFGNGGYGVRRSLTGTARVLATNCWWGDPLGGATHVVNGGTGTGTVVVTPYSDGVASHGSGYAYFDAGPNTGSGTSELLPLPTVTRGTSASDYGTLPYQNMLANSDRVTLDYAAVPAAKRYAAFLTLFNSDPTSSIGGNWQKLLRGTDTDTELLPAMVMPAAKPGVFRVNLPVASQSTLELQAVKTSGFRAVLEQVWLVEQPPTLAADGTAPTSTLVTPVAETRVSGLSLSGTSLSGLVAELTGTATDNAGGSGIALVEVGIKPGASTTITWATATVWAGNGTWSYLWSLPADGQYTILTRARDRAGNVETPSAGTHIIIDRTAPLAATNVVGLDTPGDSGGSITVSWTASPSSDVATYRIERRIAGGVYAVAGSVSVGTANFVDTGLVNGTQYWYHVVAIDTAGNAVASAESGPAIAYDNATHTPAAPNNVTNLTALAGSSFINLQWTAAADPTADLAGYFVDWSTNGAGGPYTTTLSQLTRNLNHCLISGLTNGTLYTVRVRSVNAAGTYSSGATTTATPSNYAIVNYDITVDTEWPAGTYKITKNPVYVNAGVTLTIRPGAVIKFASGCRLTVSAGATLLAQGSGPGTSEKIVFTSYRDDTYGVDVNGSSGTSGVRGDWDMVYLYDAASSASVFRYCLFCYGGSTNSGNLEVDAAGTVVDHCESTLSSNSGIYGWKSNSSAIITNCNIHDNGTNGNAYNGGIFFDANANCRPQITNCTISNNLGNGIHVAASGTQPTITGNTITGHTAAGAGYGIYFAGAPSVSPITGNTITGNNVALRVPASAFPLPGDTTNTLTPNTQKFMGITGNQLLGDTHFRVWAPGTADEVHQYVVFGTTRINVPTLRTLTVDPGVNLKFDLPASPPSASSAGIDVYGALVANGTANKPIRFTSYRDDTVDGDTNGDNNATAPRNGDWYGIVFYDSALIERTNHLNYCHVRYGGANGATNGAVYANAADITMENSEIANSSSAGFCAWYSSCTPTVSFCRIWGNVSHGVYVGSALPAIRGCEISSNRGDGLRYDAGGGGMATESQIFRNAGKGLASSSSLTINARGCWWGDTDGLGPRYGTNLTGNGSTVTGGVTLTPWRATVAVPFAYLSFGTSGVTAGSLPNPVLWAATGQFDTWNGSTGPDYAAAYNSSGPVQVKFTGLDTTRNYVLRTSFFNGDVGSRFQTLTDGTGASIQPSTLMPATAPVAYEITIPPASYQYPSDLGNLTLNFNLVAGSQNSTRAAATAVLLMEAGAGAALPNSVTVAPLTSAYRRPALAGTVSAAATVQVTVGSNSTLYQAVVNNGTWSLPADTIPSLTDGVYDVAVAATMVSDGSIVLDSTTNELTIDNVSPPVLSYPIPDQAATQGALFTFTFATTTFADVHNDNVFTYAATVGGSALPAWLHFDSATRTFSGTPGNADVGYFFVSVQATSVANLTVSTPFRITVANVNDAPTFTSTPVTAGEVGTAYAYVLAVTDVDVGDPGSSLSITAPVLPAWLALHTAPESGVVTLSGTPTQVGTYPVTLKVTDAHDAHSEQSFEIVVALGASILATTTTGLVTTETGGTAACAITLSTQPTAAVTVPLLSTNAAEGIVTPAALLFTPDNWAQPQAVIITGVDDASADGNLDYSVTVGPATSSDLRYAGLHGPDLHLTNLDDDTAGCFLFTIAATNADLPDVTLGMQPSTATDGFDAGLDSLAPGLPVTATRGSVHLYGAGSENPYQVDIRPTASSITWYLAAAAPTGQNTTLSWPAVKRPAGQALVMQECDPATGQPAVGAIAALLAAPDQLTLAAGTTKTFSLKLVATETFDLSLAQGWNLASLPVEPLDAAVDKLLADAGGSIYGGAVWHWIPAPVGQVDGHYEVAFNLHATVGYWIFCPAAKTVSVEGLTVASRLSLVPGWSLGGPAVSGTVPAGLTDLWGVWSWDPVARQYTALAAGDPLTRGHAYWFYAGQALDLQPSP